MASSIRTARSADGTLTLLVPVPPEALPPVRSRDLDAAWDTAREAAGRQAWGPRLLVRFLDGDGGTAELALVDRDACCWAAAVDGMLDLRTMHGLSVCLRLLALVDLLSGSRWADRLCRIGRAGATLDPSLLREAAVAPLTNAARFDQTAFRARLDRSSLAAPPSGAFA